MPGVSTLAGYPLSKILAKKNKWVVIAANLVHNSLRRYGLKRGQIGQPEVLSLADSQISSEVARFKAIYDQYLQYAGWSRGRVQGKRVIELGPGYTMAVPLLFAADGAKQVVGIDKFVPFQDGPSFGALYSQLRETLADSQKSAFDRAISLHPKPILNPLTVTHIYRKDLPDCVQQLGPGTYDIIVSNAVIEEIWDPTATFMAQDLLLRPGGVMAHSIDLRDYGMFSKYGFHPLEFLTVPDWIYRRMAEFSGQPDRRRTDYYRELATRMGYRAEIYFVALGVCQELSQAKRELLPGVDYPSERLQALNKMRPRLLDRYRKLPESDLLADGIIFTAKKPEITARPLAG